MWKVIQHRWIRGSTQNGSNVVWTGSRRKDAYGQAKQNIKSHLDMLIHHDYHGCEDAEVDLDNFSVILYDEHGSWYKVWYEVVEDVLVL